MPAKTPTVPDSNAPDSTVPDSGELARSEKPGGTQQMPSSPRARKQRDESNSSRDSNDLGSGVST